MKRIGLRGLAGLVLAAAVAGPAAATVTFTANYNLTYAVEATIDPATGELQSTLVTPRTYTGTFVLTLGDISEVVSAGPTPGTVTRNVTVGLDFEPFNFAPDLQTLIDAEDPGTPSTTATTGEIKFTRTENLAGDPASYVYQSMTDSLIVADTRPFDPTPPIQIYYFYNNVRTFEPGGSFDPAPLTGTSPDEIAAYFEGAAQIWSSGYSLVTYQANFQNPVYDGHNYAGTIRFSDVSFVDSAAVPEPGTWALMILGFGVVGSALRRRAGGALRV